MKELERKTNNPRVSDLTIRKLKAKCQKYEENLEYIKNDLRSFEEDAKKIEDLNNWLLYSFDYLKTNVEKCIDIFKKKILPDMHYNTVQEKFIFPKKALSSVFLFHKPINMEQAKKKIKLLIELNNFVPIDKIAKEIECIDSDISEIINELLNEKIIDGNFVNRNHFEFKSDIDIFVGNLLKKIEEQN